MQTASQHEDDKMNPDAPTQQRQQILKENSMEICRPATTLREVLDKKLITSVFQPIVDLRSQEVLGYEALSRGPHGTPFCSPVCMIEEAVAQGTLWELELAFRTSAITSAGDVGLDTLLFLNVDPNIVNDDTFREGLTVPLLEAHGLRPDLIVFEITERSAIDKFELFQAAISHYRSQGYRIAIDDMGAGYSNLNAICHIHPGFIKIDMALIRDIHQDSFKQAVVKSFVVLANLTGSKLIAEGIETMEELRTILSLGVHAGQGYLLGRPAPVPTAPDRQVMEALRFLTRAGTVLHAYNTKLIGEIVEQVPPVHIADHCVDVRRHLDDNHHEGVCVLDGRQIAGLVMRRTLNDCLSRQYGYALYANRPIARILSAAPLVVDNATPIGTVTELALSRSGESVYDNIIVSRNGRYEGMVSIISLLRHAMEIERSYALELNPLTGLPGNVQINRVLHETIRNSMETGVLYFDLDHFKVYNDLYGFEQGDAIIQLLKLLLCDVIKSDHSCASFIGHIGGDDFIAVLTCSADECGAICREIIRRFTAEVDAFFTREHREQGGFPTPHGCGLLPLTSVSIAGTYGCMCNFDSPEALARHMAELKKQAKAIPGSAWIMENQMTGTTAGTACADSPSAAC